VLGENAVVYHTNITKEVGVGKKTALKQLLKSVLEGLKKWLLSAKALDEGMDWPEAELALDLSRTSNPLQHTQRKGRNGRKLEFGDGTEKKATYINLYVKDTLDVRWLGKAQEGGIGQSLRWMDAPQEILDIEIEAEEGLN